MLPIFSEEFLGAFDLVILNITGGNAAHFFQRIFWGI